jgi:hypothetical protein
MSQIRSCRGHIRCRNWAESVAPASSARGWEPHLAEIMRSCLRSWGDPRRWPACARSPCVGSRSPWVGCCAAIEPGASVGSLVTGGRRKDRVGSDSSRYDIWPIGLFPAHKAWRRPARPLGHSGERPRHRGAGLSLGENPHLSVDPLRRTGRARPRRSRSAFVDRCVSSAICRSSFASDQERA